ncbi:hypothetical protein AB1L42_10245 [Thalassoglobus sp. JC818]|uniref:hypothetical protein n=1 Tax=Thalassoglobus sp. JC818 TaxID=3232136 RepID=UPI003457537C
MKNSRMLPREMSARHFRKVAVRLLTVCILLVGCSHRARQVQSFREEFYIGDLAQSQARLQTLIDEKRKDVDALTLDKAMIQLTAGNTHEAEQLLRGVRDRLDHLEQRDIRELAKSMVRDDNDIAWAGSDYERILIRAMLAITNLMHGGDDATAYALQVTEKQNEVIARIENSRKLDEEEVAEELHFRRLALGPYVHAALLEERHLDYDDIERSRLKVASWETDFRDAQIDLARAREGKHSERGNGVLYVFCLVGRGPQKVEAVEVPSTAAMLIADRILNEFTEQEITPTIAPIKVPVVIPGRSLIENIQVSVGNEVLGTTTTLSNISEFAVEQTAAEHSDVVARAVVRRSLKKAAIYAAKDSLGAENSGLADFALTAAGVAWEATEQADTRSWTLLPDQIQVLRAELPAGSREITLAPRILPNQVASRPLSVSTIAEIQDGRNTYVLVTIPDTQIIGEVLTSSDQSLLTLESVGESSSAVVDQ